MKEPRLTSRELDAHLAGVVRRIGISNEKERTIPPVTFEQERIDLTRALLVQRLLVQVTILASIFSAWTIACVGIVVWILSR